MAGRAARPGRRAAAGAQPGVPAGQASGPGRRTAFAAHGLETWEFDVLSALRRQGPPYQLSPGALLRATLVTSGTMTNRIDRLAERGPGQPAPRPAGQARRPGPADRARPAVADAALADLLEHERELLTGLDGGQRELLPAAAGILLAPFDADTARLDRQPRSPARRWHRWPLPRRRWPPARHGAATALSRSPRRLRQGARRQRRRTPVGRAHAPGSAARQHRYYLSLGDSLSRGVQPDPAGQTSRPTRATPTSSTPRCAAPSPASGWSSSAAAARPPPR